MTRKYGVAICVSECCTRPTTPHAEASRHAEEPKHGRESPGLQRTVVPAFVFIGEASGPPRVRPWEMLALEPWFSGFLFSRRSCLQIATHVALKNNGMPLVATVGVDEILVC